ncbi:glycosyltransferase [Adlercreutzia sp. ZJ138]|uniref:glycosyltransferase n=1 Tax=Adlercreutzia sp. ZJ138 TaxID=2709405 RepID=UPI0013EAA6EA|nr:glycosyltransferase [Adlercreutzia sp. ZJ138]
MIRHKLSNVVLEVPEHMLSYTGAYYRTDAPVFSTAGYLSFSGRIDFLTYFNSCSLSKWKKYTNIQSLNLHLELSGAGCDCSLRGAMAEDAQVLSLGPVLRLDKESAYCVDRQDKVLVFDIPIADESADLVAFELNAADITEIRSAYYYTEVSEELVNPVRLALSTTTFKKEQYIVSNIELIEHEVLGSNDPIAAAFHMFVVDNGRTLDSDGLASKGVTVLPNPNVGGAGGFARGMMEALASQDGYTHVLLMDDDVIVSPESLKRTFNLLALAKDEYQKSFINGAMLAVEQPNKQFEDVAHVLDTGAYHRIKGNMYIDDLRDVCRNEAIDVEVPNAYGAWWYSCIPLSVVRDKGLPLPLFVRCDDVEYGMRCKPTYMTMNGICVWHEGFGGRFRPNVDCYQYVRNFMIMMAVDDCASERMFVMRLNRNIMLYLRAMYYDAVELFLDGFEDYLKGPDFIAHARGDEILMQNAKKNERLVPVGQLKETDGIDVDHIQYNSKLLDFDNEPPSHIILKLWRSIPYDRHLLPDALLRSAPQVIPYSRWSAPAPRTVGTRTLVALDLDGKEGAVRRMDKSRYRRLKERWKRLKAAHMRRGREVREEYKAAMPYLTSIDFWDKYLKSLM